MQFCTSYRQSPEIKNKMTEIRYPLKHLTLALDQIKEKQNHIAIIEILNLSSGNLNEEQIHDLAVEYKNIYFDFYLFSDFKIISNKYQEQKYMYHYPIQSWIDLNYILHFDGLHSITIGEPLIFDIKKVKTLITRSRNNIQLRAYPTIGRPTVYNDYPGDHGLCHFWVLPQHIYLYENLIDIMDILSDDQEREEVLCDYYINNKPWLLQLSSFFKNMTTNVIGNYVLDEWAEKRLNCGQRCFMPSPTCHYCESQNTIYDLVKNNPQILNKENHNEKD